MAVNTAKKQPARGAGRPFKKGQSGNPKGRPKGSKNAVTLFEEALKKREKEEGVSIYELFVAKAYEDNAVLRDLMRKILPDLTDTHQTASMDEAVLVWIETQNELLDERIRALDRVEGMRAILEGPSTGWNRKIGTNGGSSASTPKAEKAVDRP